MDESKARELLRNREAEFRDLYARMDIDADLAKRTKFYLKDESGRKIPNCDNVTLPKAALFANRANTMLAAANQQMVVEGAGLNDKQTSTIEQFYGSIFQDVDRRLSNRNLQPLFSFQSQAANLRGRVAQRLTCRLEDEELVAEILPMDCRYVAYEFSSEGLEWFAYTTRRSSVQIEREYSKVIGDKYGKITDMWFKDEEFVFLDGAHLVTNENPYGYPPAVVALSPSGLMFMDDDMLKNTGESIFWLDRDLYDEANKCMSVIQTLNSGALWPPMQKEFEEIPTKKPAMPMAGKREVTPVRKGELYHPMPRQDVYEATRMAWSIIDSHIQQGSFSTIEFGTLQFPLSAIALEDLSEGRFLVLAPSLQALSVLYQQTALMIKNQFLSMGQTITLAGKGKQASYSPKDLEPEFTVKFRYYTSSRKQLIAGISEASAIGSLVSDDYKRRELLQIENPEGEAARIRSEGAERANPIILLYRQVHSLIDEDKDIEAKITFLKLKQMLMQQTSQPQEAPTDGRVEPKELIPLLGRAGGGGSRVKVPEGGEE